MHVAAREFRLRVPGRSIQIDAIAARNANGHGDQILLAEIKCFPTTSPLTSELYQAIGQYIIYRAVLKAANNPRPLYLAIPEHIYQSAFDSTVRQAVSDNQIKLLIVNLDAEEIRL